MRVKPLFIIISTLSVFLAVVLLSPTRPVDPSNSSDSPNRSEIWNVKRIVERRPCSWWLQSRLTPLPSKNNGYIRVDCYGGLNQMRRDVSAKLS